MQFIKPVKDSDIYTCPHCNTVTTVNKDTHYFRNNGLVYKSEQKYQLTIHRCLNCGKKIIWCGNEYIYPLVNSIEPNEDMPNSVKKLFNEAGSIINQSPRAACALLRLAVENLCVELDADEGDINKCIAKLVANGLPISVQQALDTVRVIGNKAVHPGQIVIDVDDKATAESLMKLLNIIVERMISEKNAIESIYAKLPQSALASIERRDKGLNT